MGWVRSRVWDAWASRVVGVAQVGADVPAPALGLAGEQRPGVDQHERVVVGVGDRALGRDLLGDLVGGARARQPGADVEELADAAAGGQVVDGATVEGPVGPGTGHHVRPTAGHLITDRPVGRVMVFAAEPVVVHPRRMRHPRIEDGTAVAGGRVGRGTNAGSARVHSGIVDYLFMPVCSRPYPYQDGAS